MIHPTFVVCFVYVSNFHISDLLRQYMMLKSKKKYLSSLSFHMFSFQELKIFGIVFFELSKVVEVVFL